MYDKCYMDLIGSGKLSELWDDVVLFEEAIHTFIGGDVTHHKL